MAQPLDPIALDVQLWDYATDKYVRARVYADGFEMPYSPIAIPHKELGYYFLFDSAIFFPENTQHFSIVYEIYKDSSFTQLSKRHAPFSEQYTFDRPPSLISDPNILKKLNQIIDIVTSHDVNSQILGEIEQDFALVGHVIQEEVIGVLYDDLILEGIVLDSSIDSLISDNDDIDGTLE